MKLGRTEATLEDLLDEMSTHGSSVILNWGEDTGKWECDFISGGVRYCAVSLYPDYALGEALAKAKQAALRREEGR